MGSSKKQTSGYRYHFGIHMGVSRGPVDELVEITVGDAVVWQGSVTDNATVSINAPEAFGGDKKEGGIQGTLRVMMGGPTQSAPAALASMLGGLVPGFRKTFTLFYDGLVCSNNPYPKKWMTRQRRVTSNWDGEVFRPDLAAIWLTPSVTNTEHVESIKAMNPAHIIFETLTNREWGRGLPRDSLDIASFEEAASILYGEGFGMCIRWTRSDEIQTFVQNILDHISATIFLSRETALLTLRLIRGGYDASALPLFDTTNGVLEIREATVASPAVTTNEIIVTYREPVTNQDRQVRVTNLASLQSSGGAFNSISRDYSGLPTSDLARRVAQRDLRVSADGLRRFSITMDRRAWNFEPGGLFRIQDAARGIPDTVVRIGKIEDGTLQAGTITLTVVQDAFSMPAASFIDEQPSLWVPPVTESCMGRFQAFEMPYFMMVRGMTPADFAMLTETSAAFGVVVEQGRPSNVEYDLAVRSGGPTEDDWPEDDSTFCGYERPGDDGGPSAFTYMLLGDVSDDDNMRVDGSPRAMPDSLGLGLGAYVSESAPSRVAFSESTPQVYIALRDPSGAYYNVADFPSIAELVGLVHIDTLDSSSFPDFPPALAAFFVNFDDEVNVDTAVEFSNGVRIETLFRLPPVPSSELASSEIQRFRVSSTGLTCTNDRTSAEVGMDGVFDLKTSGLMALSLDTYYPVEHLDGVILRSLVSYPISVSLPVEFEVLSEADITGIDGDLDYFVVNTTGIGLKELDGLWPLSVNVADASYGIRHDATIQDINTAIGVSTDLSVEIGLIGTAYSAEHTLGSPSVSQPVVGHAWTMIVDELEVVDDAAVLAGLGIAPSRFTPVANTTTQSHSTELPWWCPGADANRQIDYDYSVITTVTGDSPAIPEFDGSGGFATVSAFAAAAGAGTTLETQWQTRYVGDYGADTNWNHDFSVLHNFSRTSTSATTTILSSIDDADDVIGHVKAVIASTGLCELVPGTGTPTVSIVGSSSDFAGAQRSPVGWSMQPGWQQFDDVCALEPYTGVDVIQATSEGTRAAAPNVRFATSHMDVWARITGKPRSNASEPSGA